MRLVRSAATLVALVALQSRAPAAPVIERVRHHPDVVAAYQRLEISLNLQAVYDNPYDPREVAVEVEFRRRGGPSRRHPAFWFEGYERRPSGVGEQYRPTGERTWRGRIVAHSRGHWEYRIVARDRTGQARSQWRAFECTAGPNPGFVRVDGRDRHFLAFGDGSPYRPLGVNLCWAWDGAGFSVLRWQQDLAAAGGNWTRYWMSKHSAEQAIEWSAGGPWQGLGRYSQQISARFDAYLADAEARGIYAQLCVDSFNGWNSEVYANWSENPYNVEAGGMLAEPIELLTDEGARRLFRQRLRYVVARWGYSTAVLAWELFNEADIIGAGTTPYYLRRVEGAAWHREMGAYLDSVDAFDHLRTTSFSNDLDPLRFPEIWSLDEMDIIQGHRYSDALPASHVGLIRQMWACDKPGILAEFGVADMTVPKLAAGKLAAFHDPTGQSLHDAAWAAAVSGSAAMSWWWEEWIAPAGLWSVLTPIRRFLDGEDWAAEQLDIPTCRVQSGHQVQVYGLQGPASAYLFVRAFGGDEVDGLVIELTGLVPGALRVECWDTYAGEPVSWNDAAADAGGLKLHLPRFQRDLAVKIRPAHAAAPRSFVFTPNGDGHNDVFLLPCSALALTQPAPVRFDIYTLAGEPVRSGSTWPGPGGQPIPLWDGLGDAGRPVPPGIYLFRARARTDAGDASFASGVALAR